MPAPGIRSSVVTMATRGSKQNSKQPPTAPCHMSPYLVYNTPPHRTSNLLFKKSPLDTPISFNALIRGDPLWLCWQTLYGQMLESVSY